MNKLNIAFIFGGCSPEYAVSLQSAAAVISQVNRDKYCPILLGITSSGRWYRYRGELAAIANDTWLEDASNCTSAFISPNRGEGKLLELADSGLHETRLDAAFPLLHGVNGEDGTIQGLLQLADIPIIGCGTLASALCMDKQRAHQLVQEAGVATPFSITLRQLPEQAQLLKAVVPLGFPLFVKPVRGGSSLGISRVDEKEQLYAAVELAFTYDDTVLVEQMIPGFEVGCAVMGSAELLTGELDEIELSDGFFDYAEKYSLASSTIHMPARISAAATERIKQTAQLIYRTLGCSGFARVDMFFTPGGDIVFNEVNTIPGFTAHSRFPNMMRGAGMDFAQLVERLISEGVR